MDRHVPQLASLCYMVGELGHEEGFACFRRTCKKVEAGIEKVPDDWLEQRKGRVVKLRHGEGGEAFGFGWFDGRLKNVVGCWHKFAPFMCVRRCLKAAAL